MSESLPPFGSRLRELRLARGLTLETLAYDLRDVGGGPGFGHLGMLERGERYPQPDTLVALAKALNVDPESFPEYQLAIARRLFDEREIGLEAAVANLEAAGLSDLTAAAGAVAAGGEDGPGPPSTLARELQDARPSPGTGRAAATQRAGRSRRRA